MKNTYKIDTEILVRYEDGEPDINGMIIVLLINGLLFTNNFWWKENWPEDAQKITSLNVLCSDVFCWGCADAEEIEYKEIPKLFEHWEKDHVFGVDIWCIKKRNMMPQKPVYDDIMKQGIWNLDEMRLDENPTWKNEN